MCTNEKADNIWAKNVQKIEMLQNYLLQIENIEELEYEEVFNRRL